MREWLRHVALAAVAALCACGGSGSTGLILPESALLAEVRRDGTCIEADGISYCATDSEQAVSPDGQSALAPAETGSGPSPCPTVADDCPRDELGFTVRGFPPGAACATAVRSAEGDAWAIGALVPVGTAPTQVPVAASAGTDASIELVLLCFDVGPAGLPATVATLSETNPDVVFVPRTP
jgi:hypothetical protein